MKRIDAVHRNILAVLAAVVLSSVSLLPAMAEEEKPSADFSVSALSAYIWRGFELSHDSLVIQPSATVGYKGFSANFWGNLDTDPYTAHDEKDSSNNWTETDLTLAYSRGFFDDFLSTEVGYIYYDLNGATVSSGDPDDSQEFYLSLGLDTLLAPTLTVYKEFSHYPSWYILLSISHAFQITEAVSLELSASASYLKSQDEDAYPEIDGRGEVKGEFNNFHDGLISASLPVAVSEFFTIAPTVAYSFPLCGEASDQMEAFSRTGKDDNFLYGGVTCTFAF